jgi:hypothetical protein
MRGSPVALLSFALLAAAVLSCSDKALPGPDWRPAERIEGTWRWVRSLDVNTTHVHSPASAGFEASLTVVAESNRSGTYTYARAGAPPVAGRFTISFEDAPGNDFISIDHPIDYLTQNAWVSAGPDSLRLNGVYELGFNSTYARVR